MNSRLSRSLPALCLVLCVTAVTVGTFTGGLWAALGIGGAILMFVGTWLVQRQRPSLDPTVLRFVALVIGTIACLNLHALFPAVSWHQLLQQITIFVPLALLFSPQVQEHINTPRLFPIVTVAALIGASALGTEFLLGAPLLHYVKGSTAPISEYNRGISYLVLFAMPLMAALWLTGRRWEMVLFALILLVPASLTESRATKMSLLLGMITTLAAFVAPIMVRRALSLLLFALLAFPFVVTKIFLQNHAWINHLPPSWQHRVEIWDYMSYRIFDHPFLGWGIGSSFLLPYQEPNGALYHYATAPAGHPHNAILQLWVELGLPGLALGIMFGLFLLRRAGQLPPPLLPFALGAWMAALSMSLVAYSFWDDSLFAVFALTAFAFGCLAKQSKPTPAQTTVSQAM